MKTKTKRVRRAEPRYSRLIKSLVPEALDRFKNSMVLAGGVKQGDQSDIEAMHKRLHRYSRADRDFIIAQVFYAMAREHPEAVRKAGRDRKAMNRIASRLDVGGALTADIERTNLRDYLLREQSKKLAALATEKMKP